MKFPLTLVFSHFFEEARKLWLCRNPKTTLAIFTLLKSGTSIDVWGSDPELERQANDKISFLKFLGFLEKIADHTTSGISGNGYPKPRRIKRSGKNSKDNLREKD